MDTQENTTAQAPAQGEPTLGDALKVVFMAGFQAGETHERSGHWTPGPEEAWTKFMASKVGAASRVEG